MNLNLVNPYQVIQYLTEEKERLEVKVQELEQKLAEQEVMKQESTKQEAGIV